MTVAVRSYRLLRNIGLPIFCVFQQVKDRKTKHSGGEGTFLDRYLQMKLNN